MVFEDIIVYCRYALYGILVHSAFVRYYCPFYRSFMRILTIFCLCGVIFGCTTNNITKIDSDNVIIVEKVAPTMNIRDPQNPYRIK